MVNVHTLPSPWPRKVVLQHRVKVRDTGLFETRNFTGFRLPPRRDSPYCWLQSPTHHHPRFRQLPPCPSYKSSPQPWASTKLPKSCPLCKQAGCNDQHFLSACSHLPPEDRTYLSLFYLTSALDDEEPDYAEYTPSPFHSKDDHSPCTLACTVSCCVGTKQSPHFKATSTTTHLDTGAETRMMKSSVAHSIGAPIEQSSQQALQADVVTPLAIAGETHLILSWADEHLPLDALVVDDLEVDILVGTPFLIINDITVCPENCQVHIQDSEMIHCEHPDDTITGSHAVWCAQSFTLCAPSSTTVVWPGEYLELEIPLDLGDDRTLTLQPLQPQSIQNLPTSGLTPNLGSCWIQNPLFHTSMSQKPLVASSTAARSYLP